HGSAPDIAGKNIANPYSMIGSVAMMLDMSFDLKEESDAVWQAMQSVFESGYSTSDLSSPNEKAKIVSTIEFGDLVMKELNVLLEK
ncbi:MAG: 3-isopropylmalate dehydrogenase, partial [Candidatus Azotimanducaceae bacterium]